MTVQYALIHRYLQPYYVRMINDEIIHIISYKEEFSGKPNCTSVVVLFGVATIYRKEIALNETLRFSSEWLDEHMVIPIKEEEYKIFKEKIPLQFEYESNDESEMKRAVKDAYDLTENLIIPILNKVNSLEKCISYFYKYKPALMRLYADEKYIFEWVGGRHNEGLY